MSILNSSRLWDRWGSLSQLCSPVQTSGRNMPCCFPRQTNRRSPLNFSWVASTDHEIVASNTSLWKAPWDRIIAMFAKIISNVQIIPIYPLVMVQVKPTFHEKYKQKIEKTFLKYFILLTIKKKKNWYILFLQKKIFQKSGTRQCFGWKTFNTLLCKLDLEVTLLKQKLYFFRRCQNGCNRCAVSHGFGRVMTITLYKNWL